MPDDVQSDSEDSSGNSLSPEMEDIDKKIDIII